jgi:SPP1 family predicted phage head-tail adaptor
MWNVEVALLTPTDKFETDKIGNKIPVFDEEVILAYEKEISRNEFYIAGQSDIEITKQIVIHPFEYNGQKKLCIDGEEFSVIRSYKISNEELELTLRVKGANK